MVKMEGNDDNVVANELLCVDMTCLAVLHGDAGGGGSQIVERH